MLFKLTLPDIGEGVVEAEVQRWFVAPGDRVEEDQPLVEVMTDKATVTIPSPRPGRVVRLFSQEGAIAKVHAPLVELEVEEGAQAAVPSNGHAHAPVPAEVPAVAAAAAVATEAPRKALATPAVRAMARSLGIDLRAVHGSGKDGRVTKEDLEAARASANGKGGVEAVPLALRQAQGERSAQVATVVPVPPPPTTVRSTTRGEEERIPLRGLRKRIADNIARSKRTAAHFTFVEQADVTELVQVKHRMADAARAEGVRLTYLSFIVKAVVAALKKFPELNASLDEERNEVVVKKWYDIGIASSTDQGLIVPVIRGADRLSLLDVAREIARVARDSKAGHSRPEDVGNSTFTITSLGGLGGLFGTPVLNYPEVGIMGVHRIRPTPVVRNGQIVARDVLHVSMTGDHRVVDGQMIAGFTYQVVKYLEDPGLLFMQMV
ncbi:MAG TPA: dihydrolipoamide acetyltransferase family protein [Anaeromyxobacter sp.]|nr:dihydrolipoamide acetyltransferase family protein [Anaeromyxobacter sp.]